MFTTTGFVKHTGASLSYDRVVATEFTHLLPGIARLANSATSVTLHQVGTDVCLSASRAQRVFTSIVGESPKQYQLRVRLQRAAALLLGTSVRIVDIAVATGFQDHETFTRAFRRRFGQSPLDYRTKRSAWDSHSATHAASTAPCVGLYRIPLTSVQEITTVSTHNVERQSLEQTPVLFGRRKLDKDKVADGLAEVLPAAFGYAMSNGLAMTGPPFVRYTEQSAAFFVVEAGVPLAEAAADPGADSGLSVGSLPGGEVALVVHQGPYDTLGDAHVAMDRWLHENDVAPTGPPWEVYITDPAEVPNPADWITHLYQPI